MNLFQFINHYKSCPVCNTTYIVSFNNKSNKLFIDDQYVSVKFDVAKKFNDINYLSDYSYVYMFHIHSQHFFIDFLKKNIQCNQISTNLMQKIKNKIEITNHKLYLSCPNECIILTSNPIDIKLCELETNNLKIKSYTVNLNSKNLFKYKLPKQYEGIKMYTDVDNGTLISIEKINKSPEILEINEFIDYNKINYFISKIDTYLLLS